LNEMIEEALEIAKRDLRECYTESGILAGMGHFQQYWARDAFFACLGANSLGDFDVVKKTLRLFLDLQTADGLIPAMVSKNLKPKFKPMIVSTPVDSNALFVIAVADYARKSKDKVFVESNFKKISLAIEWLAKKDKDKDNLIEEGYLANWQDTVLKHAEVLYSNACYYHALKEFAFLAEYLGVKMIAAEYEKRAETTKLALNLKFWENEYYYDWIGLRRHNHFDSAGNILAVAWDVATKNRSKSIMDTLEKEGLNKVPVSTTYPHYPFWKIIPFLLPVRAFYYHNGFSWPWIGCMMVSALNKMGEKEKAELELARVAHQINDYCVCHEVFDTRGPVESTFLKSEKPFAWTAGLFIRAVDELVGLKGKKK